jgi:hypothetical protein
MQRVVSENQNFLLAAMLVPQCNAIATNATNKISHISQPATFSLMGHSTGPWREINHGVLQGAQIGPKSCSPG